MPKYILKKLNADGSTDKVIEHDGILRTAIDFACNLKERFGTNYIVAEMQEVNIFDTRLSGEKIEY